MDKLPAYTAVVRTLGIAGEKYQTLLNSLNKQSHPPTAVLVYLAEGYQKPKETIGTEKIIIVPKGMVAQRALDYDEVLTEWILFLDDDMEIAFDGVERILRDTIANNADVCAIDGFPHHLLPRLVKIKMALLLSAIPRIGKPHMGYTVGIGDVEYYNNNPTSDYAWSTTNSGNAFICKKDDFKKVNFKEDIWLDEAPYAYPEDKVMFYKMHLAGLKILTHYTSGFIHLDAGTAMQGERATKMAFSAARNNYIFEHLYLLPYYSRTKRCIYHALHFIRTFCNAPVSLVKKIKGQSFSKERKDGINSAKSFLSKDRSREK